MPEQPPSMTDRALRIQALLFAEGGPIALRKLAALAKIRESELSVALDELERSLSGGGLSLVRTETEAALATSPRASEVIRRAFEESLTRDIGEAGLEVLSIVLYRGPSTRAVIDHIRGVNTSTTVRTLLTRGLLERVSNPHDAREFLYRPTAELLGHLGIERVSDLPDYGTIRAEILRFEAESGQGEKDYAEPRASEEP